MKFMPTAGEMAMDWPRKCRLGVPYQGSKNQIAREIISILPRGKRFVDLFAGGCAMTHAAMISGKYDTFLVNDLHGFGVRLFMDAIAGKCNGRWREWVSREEFYAKRDTDPLIALCWSFGNNMSQYVYGEGKEEQKKQLHEQKIFDAKKTQAMYSMRCVEHLSRLQHIEQTEALERVQALELDYTEYEHRDGDVVYCDIPYRSASEEGGGYRFMKRRGMTFDFDRFYEWVQTRDYPVFVSEYEMPSGFTEIWSKQKIGLFKKTRNNEYHTHTEHVFVQAKFAAAVSDRGNC